MENVRPIEYDIVFRPNLKSFKFLGKEKIKTKILKGTNKLVLNAAELKIGNCYILHKGKKIKPSRIFLDGKKEELTITLPEKISGDAELSIEFEGILNDKLVGFYRSSYEVGGKKRFLATTQFEAADARRAFPCWDNPSAKATFSISLIVDKKLAAISNMPVIEEKSVGNNEKIVKFDKTPVMSTYLLYIAAGEFEFLEDKLGKVLIRVATTPGKKNQGKLALEFGKKFLDFYQKYFKIPYPLPKLDLIAIPDFASGAMENWGAITFRETALLFDEKTSSISTKQRIAEIISHELAHQWFGNLVTMKWWNDLWLNESFATFIGDKVVDKCFPEWNIWNQYLNTTVATALKLDALKTSHKIEVDVKSPAEISEIFDDISYEKGGSVLKMMEHYLGEEIFRRGLIKYLSDHSYGNATTNDLWKALSGVSKKPVGKIMDTWIRQVGYPIIETDLKNSKLRLMQKRFLLEGGRSGKNKWMVPIEIGTNKENFSKLLGTKSISIDVGNDFRWLKINYGQNGFYRVKYPKNILQDLRKAIENGELSDADRWGVQNDLFELSVAGKVSLKDYFGFIKCYEYETDYLVLKDILDNLNYIFLISSGEKFWDEIKKFCREFFKKHFERLGWEPRKDEKHTDALLRSYLIASLGLFGDKEILKVAKEKFGEFLKKPESLHPDLRGAVYGLSAWQGDEKTYAMMMHIYKKAETQEEKRRFLFALSDFTVESLLRRTLDFSLSKEVRSQDIFMPIVGVANNPYGRKIVWSWIKKNWKEIIKRHGGLGHRLVNRIIEGVGNLADSNTENDLREFFKKNPTPGTERTVAQTLENIRINSKFLQVMRKSF